MKTKYSGVMLIWLVTALILTACGGGGGGSTPPPVTLSSIAITPPTASLAKGTTTHLTATGTFSNGSTADITTQVTWNSAAPATASIVSTTGVVTGAAIGATTVSASLNGVNSAAANITVSAAVVTSINIAPAATSIPKGTTTTFTATGTYSDSTTGDISGSVTWASSNVTVATVSSSGITNGLALGNSTVTASMNGITSNSATLTVIAPLVTSITVTPSAASIAIGSTIGLAATASYTDGTSAIVTTTATWSSFDTAIATVGSATGVVTGVTVGNVTIFAAVGSVTSPGVTVSVYNYFSVATVTDPLARQQWGLLNTGQNGYADTAGIANTTGLLGTDINVDPVYRTYGYTGRGVIVAVVDTGLEIAHEDLAANVVPGGSWNFVNSTTNPTNTVDTTGDHGTSVSGLIAMAKSGIGGIGVAPNAQLKGFNYLALTTPLVSNRIAALGGSTASPNSSDVFIFNQSFGSSSTTDSQVNTTVQAQYFSGVTTLRGGKGALYVKSAGNGFQGFGTTPTAAVCTAANTIGVSCENANFDPYNTLPYNIVVAALNAKGIKSSYSTAGSAIWASAPGGEYGSNAAAATALGVAFASYDPAMVTTDQSGCTAGYSMSTPTAAAGPYSYFDWGGTNVGGVNLNCNYTNNMSGTSSAAPMMSGVIALMLEANPALTWREVKDILAKTAVQVDAANPGVTVALGNGNYVAELPWITNAAGYKFHNWYGFGAVNASAAVTMAKTYVSGSLGAFAWSGWISSGLINQPIPDNSVTGTGWLLPVPKVVSAGIVETVQVDITTANTLSGWTGDIGIELTSPSGTKSILKNIKDGFNATNFAGMVLASNAFYGESSTGNWTIKVVDGWAGGTQALTNVQIQIFGH